MGTVKTNKNEPTPTPTTKGKQQVKSEL